MYRDMIVNNEHINNHIAFDCMKQYTSASVRYNLVTLINKFIIPLYVATELTEDAINFSKDKIQEAFENTFGTNHIKYFDIIDSLNIKYMRSTDTNATEVGYVLADIKSKLATSPKFIQFIIDYIHYDSINTNVTLVTNDDNVIRVISNIYSLTDINDKFRLVRVVKVDNINKIQKGNLGFKKSNDPFMKYYDYILAISESINIDTIRRESKFIKQNKVR